MGKESGLDYFQLIEDLEKYIIDKPVSKEILRYKFSQDFFPMRIAVLSDWHWGNECCFYDKARAVVNLIKKNNWWWVGLGDLLENALIDSPGGPYDQIASPNKQFIEVVELLKPIASKCLGIASGNHEDRTRRKSGIKLSLLLAHYLGIPEKYCGYSLCMVINKSFPKSGNASFRIIGHHGTGGGRTKGGKANLFTRLAEIYPTADLYIIGHTHQQAYWADRCFDFDTGNGIMRAIERQYYMAGSFLEYFNSYAEMGMKPPASPKFLVLELDAKRVYSPKKNIVKSIKGDYI